MAFFDKINSIAKNVGDKTGDAIEMAKINARIASERSAMNDIYRQLGEVYYAHRVNGGEGEPAEAAAIYSQLDQRTAAIDEAQKQIVAIKAEGERRAAEAAAAEESAYIPFAETEVVSLQAARDRKAGDYHLMSGQNPIYIFTMQGGGETA